MKITGIGKLALLIIAAGIAIGVWRMMPKSQKITGQEPIAQTPPERPAALPTQVTVKGQIGSEKSGFLEDAEVQRILREKYALSVDSKSVGSIEMVRNTPADLDFLWPSSEIALEIYKEKQAPLRKAEVIFNSPLVLYSWADTTNALIQQGIVKRIDNAYFIVDFPKLVELMTQGKKWKDIGLPQFFGPIAVHSTDPQKSNSGLMFAGLLANVLNKGDVVDAQSARQVQPTLKTFFRRLGYLQTGSGNLFEQFLQMGEGAYPLMVGYENQLIEFGIAHEPSRATLNQQVRILYPRPTSWSAHPLIALTDNGARFLDALKNDADLQRIAWEKHGFRSGNLSLTTNSKKNWPGVAPKIQSVIPSPPPAVMEQIIAGL